MSHLLAIGLDRNACAAIAAALGVDGRIVAVDAASAARVVEEEAAAAAAVILGEGVADPDETARRIRHAAPTLPILLLVGADGVDTGNAVSDPRGGAASKAVSDRRRAAPRDDTAAAAPTVEELSEAVRSRDEFFSLASHELKTPLTPLKLQVQILARRAEKIARDAEAQAWLEQRLAIIHRQTDRLAALVSDLLDVSRIAGGRLAVSPAPTDLGAVTRAVIDRIRREGEFERAGVTIALSAPAQAVGAWDRARLEQLVTNLLGNALKCGPGHAIAVEVSIDDAEAELRVACNGAPAPPGGERRLLDNFEQAAPHGLPSHGGFGLGLYIARAVAGLLGGRVAVDGDGDGLVTFTVTLPR